VLVANISLPTLRAGTSRFKPREGVNVFRLSEAALSTAGAKVPGPGVIISLSEHDVSWLDNDAS